MSSKDRTTREVRPISRFAPSPTSGTRRVSPRAVRQMTNIGGPTLGNLMPGARILDEYVVLATLHPHETSHPGLFRCAAHGGQEVVVKVAPILHPPKLDLWVALPKLHNRNVVKTLQVIEHDGLYYEIQEYCQGGSLGECIGNERIDPDWIAGHLVPQVNEGLKYLHAKDIVHRDVKPSNLYLRQNDLDGDIVVGDFDISSMLVSDRTSRNTSRMAGTWAYTAPEAFPRFVGDGPTSTAARITRTADYYSLGIAIIELLTGTTSLHSCGLPDLYDFYLTGGKVELPDVPSSLLLLLKGLLVRNRHERWSGPEVDRWLRGANIREDMQAVINDQRFSLAKATRPYPIGGLQAVDLPSLAMAMEKAPHEAKSHLLESDLLTQWIANQDAAVGHQVERARERFRNNPDLALYRCILLCDRNRPLEIPEYGTVESVAEWGPLLAKTAPTEKHLHNGPVSDYELARLEAWLELKVEPNPQLAGRVAEIRKRPIGVRFEELAFLFERKLPYSGQTSAFLNLRRTEDQWLGGHTPKEIVAEAFGIAPDWDLGHPPCFRASRDRWEQGHLEAWLRQRALADLANKAATAAAPLKGNIDESFDTFLRHLDPWADKPQILFDEEATSGEIAVEYGASASITLSYRTVGAGFPMGSVKLDGAASHVTLDNFRIRGRSGKITVGINPRTSLMGNVTQETFRIASDRGNFWMEEDGATIRYSVVFPLLATLKRLVIGGVAGGLCFGLAREIASMGVRGAVGFDGILHPDLNDPVGGLAYTMAALICLSGLYLGFRLWLEAFKRSGR